MKIYRLTISVIVMSMCALMALPAMSAEYEVTYGIIGGEGANKYFSQETTNIPLRYKESGFKWGFKVTSMPPENHNGRFVFRLPAPPKTFGLSLMLRSKVAEDRMQFTSGFYFINGEYWRSMGFDEGDPTGICEVNVYVEEKLIKTIRFNVYEEK